MGSPSSHTSSTINEATEAFQRKRKMSARPPGMSRPRFPANRPGTSVTNFNTSASDNRVNLIAVPTQLISGTTALDRRWTGTPMAYEGYLTDNYALLAVPLRQTGIAWNRGFWPVTALS